MLTRGVSTLCNLSRLSLPRSGFTLCQPARCAVRLYTKDNNGTNGGNTYMEQLMEASDSFLQQKNFDQATTTLRKLVELDPANVRAYTNLAAVLMMQNRFDLAKPIVEKALQLDPNNINNVTNMGSCLMKEGRYSDALPYLEKATTLNPSFWRALFNLSNVYLALQRSDEALEIIRRARLINPREPSILITHVAALRVRITDTAERLIAAAQQQQQQQQQPMRSLSEEAQIKQQMQSDIEEFIARCNDIVELKNLIFVEKMRKECDVLLLVPRYSGMFAKAILPTLEKACELFPQYIPLLVNSSMTSFVAENLEKARTFITTAISLDPKNVGLYQLYGEVSFNYFQKHRASPSDETMRTAQLTMEETTMLQQNVFTPLKEALKLQPNLVRANYNLGRAHWASGEHQSAVDHFAHVVELEPKHESVHRDLGKLCYELNLVDQAIAHFETAIQISPSNAKYHFEYFIALVRKEQEDAEEKRVQKSNRAAAVYNREQQQGVDMSAKALRMLELASLLDPKSYAPAFNHAKAGGKFNVQDML